jgi:AcrR family transcriptional regulator
MSSKPGGVSRDWARKRPVTRGRVLAAAAAVVAEKGFQRASLDEIAARAGLTKGAVYSSFASKDELFLALMQAQPLQLAPKLEPGMTRDAYFRALGEAAAALLPKARTHGALFAEFFLYALTHAPMRERLVAIYEDRSRDAAAAAPLRADQPLALPAREMSSLVQALALGLMFQHLLTPEEITPELVIKAFELLGAPPKGQGPGVA